MNPSVRVRDERLSQVGVSLAEPCRDWLPAYADALRAGWSPNTQRDVSGEELAAIAADPDAALLAIARTDGGRRLADGTWQAWLPGRVFWILDDSFCGTINLRYQPSTEALPQGVSGHVGYAVVPWLRRRGIATEALRQMLPIAAAVTGLRRLSVTCDHDNTASRATIEANGGVLADDAPSGKLLFMIALDPSRFRVVTGGGRGESP